MALLADLPPEILVAIAQWVPLNALFNLTLTSKWVRKVANPELYASAVRDYELRSIALFYAVHKGQTRSVQLFLDAGINPNLYWVWKYDTYHYSPPENAIGIFHGSIRGVDDFKRWSHMGKAVYATPGGSRSESEDSYEVERATAYRAFHRWTPLHVAVRLGYEEIVRLLLDRGADPKLSSRDVCMCRTTSELGTNYSSGRLHENFYPLHLATCSGHDSVAKMLLKNGDPLHFTAEKMKELPALHMAAKYGRLELLKYLAENHYQDKINTLDGINQAAMDYAYTYGHWDCFEYLLSMGATINPVDNDAHSLRPSMLVDACHHQNFEDALRLIGYGAKTDVKWTDEMGNTWNVLGICLRAPWMEKPTRSHYMQYLRNSTLTRNQYTSLPPKFTQGEFHEAGLQLIKIVAERGADVNEKGPEEFPLVAATRYSLTEVVKYLLSVGADPNCSIDGPDAPLLAACSVENVRLNTPIVPILLRHGAIANIHNTKGESPLHLVCMGCSNVHNEAQASTTLETIELLLKGGADPNCTIRGRSPLQLVCNSCSGNAADHHKSAAALGAIKLLLDYGADPNPRTQMDGGTMNAFEKALSQADHAAATLLLTKMHADAFEKSDFDKMFKAVARLSDKGCLELILSLDKDNVILQDDQSVLRLLKRGQNSTEAVGLLLDRGAPLGTHDDGDGNEVYWAVRNLRGVDLVRRLIECGASPDSIRQKKGANTCPLITAMRFKTHETMRDYVKVLLDYGADADLQVGVQDNDNSLTDITLTPRSVARGIWGVSEFVDSILASRKEASK